MTTTLVGGHNAPWAGDESEAVVVDLPFYQVQRDVLLTYDGVTDSAWSSGPRAAVVVKLDVQLSITRHERESMRLTHARADRQSV